jgi:hypothetical protein
LQGKSLVSDTYPTKLLVSTLLTDLMSDENRIASLISGVMCNTNT